MSVKTEGINDYKKVFKRAKESLKAGRLELNKARAKAFLTYTKTALRNQELGLKANQEPYKTMKFKKVGHTIPMIYNKHLIDHMASRDDRRDGSVESGYFENDPSIHPEANITYYKLAAIHHAGFTKGGTTIPPRPFVWNAGHRFSKNQDNEIIDRQVDKILRRALKGVL